MFFGEKFRRKYALTNQGIINVKKSTFWTVIVNLVVMCGMGILYFLMMTTAVELLMLPLAFLLNEFGDIVAL